jgi:hypothetical protein
MPQNEFPWNSGGEAPTWDDIQDKPTTFAPIIGTTATTAKAGNYAPPAATTAAAGTVKAAAHQAASTAPDIATMVTNFNALLTALQTAGIMAAS